jgi:hypothetical protein
VFVSIIPAANFVIEMKTTVIDLSLLLTVPWSSFFVALLTIMAVSCSLAVYECNRFPVIVQKIMLHNENGSEEMNELEKVFTQFKAMKIEFSACGMYKIDLAFLCGIFGAALSYLIIFTQL